MFTWICPQCGREVPTHVAECPNCAGKAKEGAPEAGQPPAAGSAPPQPVYVVRPRSSGIPTWLLTVVFALAFVGLGAGIYWSVGYFRGQSQAASPPGNADDTAVLFAELRRVAGTGVAVVYITHRLAEVRELCQQVTVLRDGSVRGTHPVSEITDGQLLELIVGRAVTAEFPPKPAGLTGPPA